MSSEDLDYGVINRWMKRNSVSSSKSGENGANGLDEDQYIEAEMTEDGQ